MFEIFVETHFSAAHHLRDYNGNCARWHGHNWKVTVFVEASEVDELGLAVDFRRVKQELNTILERYDHANLNDLDEFINVNPTCEILSQLIYRSLSAKLNKDKLRVTKVRISETPTTGVTYYE